MNNTVCRLNECHTGRLKNQADFEAFLSKQDDSDEKARTAQSDGTEDQIAEGHDRLLYEMKE